MRREIAILKKHSISVLILLIIILSGLLFWLQNEDKDLTLVEPKYHFYFIAQNSVDPFWKEVRLGIEDAADKFNVIVEANSPRFNNPSEQLDYLDIAIVSNVDGIITHVSNDSYVASSNPKKGSVINKSFTSYINNAYSKGIPIVTIENDAKNSNRNAFVGTNSYIIGKEAAQLMISATKANANIAVIDSSDIELDTVSQNLKMTGFLSAIKEYPNMKLIKTYNSKMGILSAEEIIHNIINSEEEISSIFTSSSIDTLGAAQAIVDNNQVGNIILVGYGDTKEILRYINKGIVYGTVMSDPYKMGYESIKALMDIKEMNNTSTFVDTGVKTITKNNLYLYEEKAEDKE